MISNSSANFNLQFEAGLQWITLDKFSKKRYNNNHENQNRSE
ncbi:hypothetical protein SR187_3505 [Streptococcus ruminantium]|uniref:Uncharacterized protein n=1 Tax=Streptococcus ruminantium TaxID=1917441 RepID=A0A2Z5TLS9_9STRE|nr:hypothetical protein SR187_3505 [Streptococcus ruminantium]